MLGVVVIPFDERFKPGCAARVAPWRNFGQRVRATPDQSSS